MEHLEEVSRVVHGIVGPEQHAVGSDSANLARGLLRGPAPRLPDLVQTRRGVGVEIGIARGEASHLVLGTEAEVRELYVDLRPAAQHLLEVAGVAPGRLSPVAPRTGLREHENPVLLRLLEDDGDPRIVGARPQEHRRDLETAGALGELVGDLRRDLLLGHEQRVEADQAREPSGVLRDGVHRPLVEREPLFDDAAPDLLTPRGRVGGIRQPFVDAVLGGHPRNHQDAPHPRLLHQGEKLLGSAVAGRIGEAKALLESESGRGLRLYVGVEVDGARAHAPIVTPRERSRPATILRDTQEPESEMD